MDKILISGGKKLSGEILIGGAKNAALPLMAACLLTEEKLTILGLPDVADIKAMANLLGRLGVSVDDKSQQRCVGQSSQLQAGPLINTKAPYDIVRKMRASVLVLGPLLARFGHASVSLPGGCAIGTRPVDLHLNALIEMGAKIQINEGYIEASVKGRLKGANIVFPQVTVGGTENILMASTLAEGKTTIANAAREPEVSDLANCLKAMGAEIEGIGTDTLTVHGVNVLGSAMHTVIPDRIEAGTYAIAASITGGNIILKNTRLQNNEAVIRALSKARVLIQEVENGLSISCNKDTVRGIDLVTEPYPGFPSDMQAQFMALMCFANGASMITENIFENRFMHVPELVRMGADINVHGASAIVRGVKKMSGAPVMATDLRASVSLILAALAAEGETMISRVYHLDRGYEQLVQKLKSCGAEIERVS